MKEYRYGIGKKVGSTGICGEAKPVNKKGEIIEDRIDENGQRVWSFGRAIQKTQRQMGDKEGRKESMVAYACLMAEEWQEQDTR